MERLSEESKNVKDIIDWSFLVSNVANRDSPPLVFKMVAIFLAPVPIGILWAKETLKKDMKKLTKGRRI